MNADSYFYIGHSHNACEDYALTHINKNSQYPIAIAIVSDGCSSSIDVDIGSRVLSKVANTILIDNININTLEFNVDNINEKIIHSADYAIKALNIERSSLDATLLFAISNGKKLKIHAYGDGFIILQKTNNDIEFYKIVYETNAPYYLSYFLSKENNQKYLDLGADHPKLIKHYLNEKLLSTDTSSSLTMFSLDLDIETTNIKSCTICSDGLDSFIKDLNQVDCVGIVKNFVSFKNTQGDFVKRRIKAYLRECQKNNIKHEDDISIATINFK